MDNTLILHILRNTYGWDEEKIRDVRLAAADMIEQQAAEIKRLKVSLEEIGNTACGEASHQYIALAALATIDAAMQEEVK